MVTNFVSAVRDILVVIATGYSLKSRGNDSWREARLSAPIHRFHAPHTVSCSMGNGVIRGVKRPGCGVEKQPPFSSVVKERIDLSSPRGTNCRIEILTQSKELAKIFGGKERVLTRKTRKNND